MILLDTDVAVDLLRGRSAAVQWWSSLDPAEAVAAPGYVALELIDGCQNTADLTAVQRFLRPFRIIWLELQDGDRALDAYAHRRLANALDPLDILIAQTALRLNQPLHTFNQKHFKVIPHLHTIQPYTR
jgi:predicted nucleic acid-binding protein